MPNGIDFGGPYYRSALRQQETQRRALTGKGYSPAEYAAISRGELEARYTGELEKARYEEQKTLAERGLDIQEETAKAQGRAATISGIAGLAGGAAAIGGGISAVSAATAATAATTAAATAMPTAGIAGTAGGLGILETIGTFLAPLIGCCWTFLEGEMLTKNVRRYRDEHYDKFTSHASWGYRWMSAWLVPIMKRHKLIKFFVKWAMLKPLASYADWYYGENWYGYVFYPLKVFWTNFWRVTGLMVQSLVEKEVL